MKTIVAFLFCCLSVVGQQTLFDTFSNVAASPCSSANDGQLAFTKEGIYTGRCNGVIGSWAWFYQGVSVIPPSATGWTLEATGDSTITADAAGTVTFFFGKRGSVALDAAYRSGFTSQTVTALFCPDLGNIVANSTDNGTDTASSLGFRDSAGRYTSLWSTIGSTLGNPPNFYVSIDNWTSATNYTSSIWYAGNNATATAAPWVSQTCHWRRIHEDGANMSHSWNLTGSLNDWVQFWQGGQFSFLGSGVHSPAIMGYQLGNGQRIRLISWKAE